jgi:hypothetical protein
VFTLYVPLFVKLEPTESVPVIVPIVPEFVRIPVVVAEPEPILKIPAFVNAALNNVLPELFETRPVAVVLADPENVSVPLVEDTEPAIVLVDVIVMEPLVDVTAPPALTSSVEDAESVLSMRFKFPVLDTELIVIVSPVAIVVVFPGIMTRSPLVGTCAHDQLAAVLKSCAVAPPALANVHVSADVGRAIKTKAIKALRKTIALIAKYFPVRRT